MRNWIAIASIAAAVSIFAGLQLGSTSYAAPAADGKSIFLANCASCHRANGGGAGPFPPLAGNPAVTSPDTRDLVAILLNGKTGPITVEGKTYGGAMPAWRDRLSNAQIASVLTYIRSAWGNKAPPVSNDQVEAARTPVMFSGAEIYGAKCATCHQASGKGVPGVYPPLAHNPHVTAANPQAVVATIVNGRSSVLTVNGKMYHKTMPTWKGVLSPSDIAAVATYVRSAWGNEASGVTEQQVLSAGSPVVSTIGFSIYSQRCLLCHGANGKGRPGIPALAGNPHVNSGDPMVVVSKIAYGGSNMPAWRGQFTDADIAAVATYIRSAWGNSAGPVTIGDVVSLKAGAINEEIKSPPK